MQSLHDSDLPSGERPSYAVVTWTDRNQRKFFRNCADKQQAESLAEELRMYGVRAEVLPVGEL